MNDLPLYVMGTQTLATRLKRAREAKGLKQSELAKLVGITPSAISQWESGLIGRIDGANLLSAARALGVTADWLLGGIGNGPDATADERPSYGHPLPEDLVQLWQKLTASQQADMLDQLRGIADKNQEILQELLKR